MKQLKAFFENKIGRTVLVVAVSLLIVAANLLLCLGTVKGAFFQLLCKNIHVAGGSIFK